MLNSAARFVSFQEAEEKGLDPTPSIMLQIKWAREAAFPKNQLVSQYTQTRLLNSISSKQFSCFEAAPGRTTIRPDLGTVKVPLPFGLAAAALVDVVPLSQISEATLCERKRSKRVDDSESVGSSSWATMSSSNGSSFSRVSVDSLGELHEPLMRANHEPFLRANVHPSVWAKP